MSGRAGGDGNSDDGGALGGLLLSWGRNRLGAVVVADAAGAVGDGSWAGCSRVLVKLSSSLISTTRAFRAFRLTGNGVLNLLGRGASDLDGVGGGRGDGGAGRAVGDGGRARGDGDHVGYV